MAYIELHQSLLRHPKTTALIVELRGDRHKAVGHLVSLWCWALDVADVDGKLPRGTTDAAIADGAGWPVEDAGTFVKAMRRAGFMEKRGYQLHDWKDYTWRYHAARNANSKGGSLGNHKRWHVDRGVIAPDCEFCRGDIAPDSPTDSGRYQSVTRGESHTPTHPPNDPPIDLTNRIATKQPASENPLNLTDAQWGHVQEKFPGVNVLGYWREWVRWVEVSKKVPPDDKVGALIGFIQSKTKQSSIPAAGR